MPRPQAEGHEAETSFPAAAVERPVTQAEAGAAPLKLVAVNTDRRRPVAGSARRPRLAEVDRFAGSRASSADCPTAARAVASGSRRRANRTRSMHLGFADHLRATGYLPIVDPS